MVGVPNQVEMRANAVRPYVRIGALVATVITTKLDTSGMVARVRDRASRRTDVLARGLLLAGLALAGGLMSGCCHERKCYGLPATSLEIDDCYVSADGDDLVVELSGQPDHYWQLFLSTHGAVGGPACPTQTAESGEPAVEEVIVEQVEAVEEVPAEEAGEGELRGEGIVVWSVEEQAVETVPLERTSLGAFSLDLAQARAVTDRMGAGRFDCCGLAHDVAFSLKPGKTFIGDIAEWAGVEPETTTRCVWFQAVSDADPDELSVSPGETSGVCVVRVDMIE